jgi:hypothetical protein
MVHNHKQQRVDVMETQHHRQQHANGCGDGTDENGHGYGDGTDTTAGSNRVMVMVVRTQPQAGGQQRVDED